jgi:hypothetical protein
MLGLAAVLILHYRQTLPYRIREGLPVIRPESMPSAEITSCKLLFGTNLAFLAKPFLFLALHSRSGMATLKNAGLFLLGELSRAG